MPPIRLRRNSDANSGWNLRYEDRTVSWLHVAALLVEQVLHVA
jgi:hypothetical protein